MTTSLCAACGLSLIAPLSVALKPIRRYMAIRKNMDVQLQDYNIRSVDCHDEADRTKVYASIAESLGHSHQKIDEGLDDFNTFVRRRFREHFLTSIGPLHTVPYRWVLLIGFPAAMLIMDVGAGLGHIGGSEDLTGEKCFLCWALAVMLATVPLEVSAVLSYAAAFSLQHETWLGETLVNIGGAIMLGALWGFLFFVTCLGVCGGPLANFLWCCTIGILVFRIYRIK